MNLPVRLWLPVAVSSSGWTTYDLWMALSTELAASPGRYFGIGHSVESGPFVSRIEVARLPNGGAIIGYEATSVEQGVQHLEHTMLVAGPDGRDRLFVAHSESPFVTEMIETEPSFGSIRRTRTIRSICHGDRDRDP